MSHAYYMNHKEIDISGILIAYQTVPGGHRPLHWHEELELLYPLNGESSITIEGKKYRLLKKHLIAVESCQVHSTHSYKDTSMYICIHILKKHMQKFFPDIELYQIRCYPELIPDERFPAYLEICRMMETLTRIYIEDATAFQLEAQGIVFQILARLIRDFSVNTAPELNATDVLTRERIREILSYVEEHFREPIALTDIASHIGVGKEYFCRFFKKNIGISFINYLTETRLTHSYYDLISTDAPVAEIMENNGFSNQKLFNRSFKELYGCTPSAARKNSSEKEFNISSCLVPPFPPLETP